MMIVHGHRPAGVLEGKSGQCQGDWTGQYPLSPWTMTTESMDNVQGVHGFSRHCPGYLDFIQGISE